MSEPSPEAIPLVLFDIADVLPQFAGADLESQLQTFDIFLEMLSPLARPEIAAILRGAAEKTHQDTSRARIEVAAQSVADGGRAAAPYNHREAMRAYRAQHAKNYAPRPVEEPPASPSPAPPTPPRRRDGRIVSEGDYQSAIRRAKAVKDPTLPWRNTGEVERWIAPDGQVVAWMIVRYFKGEEDCDYYIST